MEERRKQGRDKNKNDDKTEYEKYTSKEDKITINKKRKLLEITFLLIQKWKISLVSQGKKCIY